MQDADAAAKAEADAAAAKAEDDADADAAAKEELTIRQNELISIHKDLLNMQDADAAEKAKADAAAKEKADAAEKAKADAAEKEKADDSNSNIKTPLIIGGVVVVALVAGAITYKKNSSSYEGGEKVIRNLFKTLFRKNSNKTAVKETLL